MTAAVVPRAIGDDSCELARVHERTVVPRLDDHETRIRTLEQVTTRHAVILSIAAAVGSVAGSALMTWLLGG